MSSCLMTADEAAEEWPRTNEAIGCLDCERIYRRPEPLTAKCPHCGSESIYDATRQVDQRITAQHLRLIAKLDAVLSLQPHVAEGQRVGEDRRDNVQNEHEHHDPDSDRLEGLVDRQEADEPHAEADDDDEHDETD